MKDDLRYSVSDCFETFPFPENNEATPLLAKAGNDYFEFRSKVMRVNNEGLTKTYGRFHDPEERSENMLELRKLREAIDTAVMQAYGWTDVSLKYDFILDYEDEDMDGKKKKPFRYKITAEVSEVILSRLLSLNKTKYENEVRLGLHKR
jgi:hypothetical protein